MKKTHKKIENNLHKRLTIACENIKDLTPSLSWLTHNVNYDNFPQSLSINCYIINKESINLIENSNLDLMIKQIIKNQLKLIGIDNFNVNKQIIYMVEH